MDYLTRCQFLLQQGSSVADAAYFCGQSTPVVVRSGTPPLPFGYDYDDINADVLLTRAKVVNHRLVLNSGANYAVLVLPEADPEMTPQLLEKIREFVHDGLIVVGPRPDHSPSLQDYPACDQEVQKLAAELWSDCDGKTVTEHALGDGKVVWGQPLDKVFSGLHLSPDFQANGPGQMNYVHRTLPNGDIYFIAQNGGDAVHEDCSFRVSGRIPELWRPDTGVMEPAPAYQVKDGRTTVPIDFDPSGSVFVVFRQADATTGDHVVTASRQLVNNPAIPVEGSWVLNFPPNWGAPPSVTLDQLISWPDYPDQGVKYFSGTATYVKDIDIPAELLAKGNLLFLDLGGVKNLARVKLNGTDLGILWKPPFRVDIASAAKPGTNHLEISVVNLWPNRLIGDEQLPADVEWRSDGGMDKWPQWVLDGSPSPAGRLTFTNWHHITKDMPLLPSGLLGPVTLQPAKWAPAK
jgi:alpha-L-rhamnosidase